MTWENNFDDYGSMGAELNRSRVSHDQMLVQEFLKYGHVGSVYSNHSAGELAISEPQYGRLLDSWDGSYWGVVRLAGRQRVGMTDVINFFTKLVEGNKHIATLWRSTPPTLRDRMGSPETLNRIFNLVKRGKTDAEGVACIVSPKGRPDLALVANDNSSSNRWVGKQQGDLSLPMGYCDRDCPTLKGVHRVMQREVWTDLVLQRELPYDLLPERPVPFMHINIMNVRVGVCAFEVPAEYLTNCSSNVLTGHRLVPVNHIALGYDQTNGRYRFGVREIALGYQEYLRGRFQPSIPATLHTEAEINSVIRTFQPTAPVFALR